MDKIIKGPEDLIVYQKAYNFGLDVIKICRFLPRIDEARILKSQLIRSSTSISANIAEGYGGSRKGSSYENYLTIARRSATESKTWLKFCLDCNFLKDGDYQKLFSECGAIIAILTTIIRKVKK